MTTKKLNRNVRRGIITRAALAIFSAMLLLTACENDNNNNSPIDRGDDETTITFSVSVPKEFTPSTYALSDEEEKTVSTVDVLLFNSSTKAYVSGPHYGVVSGGNVTVRIPDTAGSYDMVVLANCNDEVSSVAISLSGKTKADVLALAGLRKTLTAGNGDDGLVGGTGAGWLTSAGNKTIPMYGETTVTVSGSTAAVGGSVNLVRMLARINVTNSATSTFTLSSVYLCNYNNVGQIAPASAWSTTNPTLVSSAQTGYTKAIKYATTGTNKSERDIYTFEAAAGSLDGANNPCLVVAGTYGGATNYYRVDFVNASSTYQPLLRNYTYEVGITQISGKGYSTMREALESRPVNIQYDITPWNSGSVSNVVYDGQYALGVSQNSFTFDNSLRNTSSTDNTVTVTTNFPTAWTVSVPTQSPAGWLTATKSGSTVQLTCAANGTGSARTATVRITAGRMVQDISVTQIKDAVSISFGGAVSGDELYFESKAGTAPTAKSFTLSWTPTDTKPAYVSNFTTGTVAGSSLPASGTVTQSSGASISVAPTAISVADFNSGITERTSVITYQLFYGGAAVNKVLKIRQKAFLDPLPVSINTAQYYPRTGSKEKFFITSTSGSNVPWVVREVRAISGSGFTMSNINTTSGTTTPITSTNVGNIVEFTPDNSPTDNVKAVVTLGGDGYSDIPVILNVGGTYTINRAPSDVIWAGSNIYYNGSNLTFDDIDSNTSVTPNEQKQGIFFKWGSLYGISPYGEPLSSETEIYPHTGGMTTVSSWDDITFKSGSLANNNSRAYLYEITDNSLGDICKRLTDLGFAPGSIAGNRWRMPTGAEFGVNVANYPIVGNLDTELSVPNTIVGTAGCFSIEVGRTNNNFAPQPFYPAAGYYSGSNNDGNDGLLTSVGRVGYYWSASSTINTAYYMLFSSTNLSLDTYWSTIRTYGFSVRCVRE